MRIRATVAAVSGALALASLAVPAAQASDKPAVTALSTFAAKAGAADSVGDTKITKVVVNGGKDIVLGTGGKKTVSVAVTATDPAGIDGGAAFLWHGASFTDDGIDGGLFPATDYAACTVVNATTSTCKVSITIDPQADLYKNALAGSWKVYALVGGKDGDYVEKEIAGTAKIKRNTVVTVNATPEPVKKGKTITVTGKLTRANWETHKYAGYTGQSVQLQFRKKGTTAYKTVKTVKSSSTGALKTTVKASVDGYWRYNFVTTSLSGASVSTADFVDVK
ncbi:calcium-binding protein [Streptomyces sp. NBC_00510]